MKRAMRHSNTVMVFGILSGLSGISMSSPTLLKKMNLKMKMRGYGIKRRWKSPGLVRELTLDLVERRFLASIKML
jgi:hypothetical protein